MNIRRLNAIVIVFLLALTAACSLHTKQDYLRSSLVAVNTAGDGFLVWDEQHKQKIVDESITYEEGEKDLSNYIAKRETIVLAFELAYRSLATAALDPSDLNISVLKANLQLLFDVVDRITNQGSS